MTFSEEWINRPDNYNDMTDGKRAAYWFAKGAARPQADHGLEVCSNALLNCPFCGADCEITDMDHQGGKVYRVQCINKAVTHKLDWWDNTQAEAAETWGARAV